MKELPYSFLPREWKRTKEK